MVYSSKAYLTLAVSGLVLSTLLLLSMIFIFRGMGISTREGMIDIPNALSRDLNAMIANKVSRE